MMKVYEEIKKEPLGERKGYLKEKGTSANVLITCSFFCIKYYKNSIIKLS